MKYRLLNGDIDEFAIFSEEIPIQASDIMIENAISVKLNVEEKKIALVNTIFYLLNEEKLLKLKSTLYFKIVDESWDEMIVDKNLVIPKEKIQHLGIISTGTSRGILIAKTANTPFSKLILPPVKVQEILYEDIVFELK